MKNSGKFVLLLFCFFSSFFVGMCSTTAPPKKDMEKIRKPVIVAVIDTGFDFDSKWDSAEYAIKTPKLCKQGHKDFTATGLVDNAGHGTHIAGLIGKYAGDAHYCLVIMKFYDTVGTNNRLVSTVSALRRAIDLKVDIINYSAGGEERSELECAEIKKALDMGIKIVVAAGNESKNINKTPYYPAMCDNRVIAVANVMCEQIQEGDTVKQVCTYARSSNFTDNEPGSRFLRKENGFYVGSILPGGSYGYMTGTSQAAAITTGKIIRNWKRR